MKIIIKKDFKDDYTTREAGERLRQMIVDCEKKVELDFLGLKIASASFFDESIAKLKSEEGWDEKIVTDKLIIKNIFRRDLDLLVSVCAFRDLNINKIRIENDIEA